MVASINVTAAKGMSAFLLIQHNFLGFYNEAIKKIAET